MSVSSSEGSPLPVDLTVKYQKLAAEYAKVRSQVLVLKKALLDEQTRSSELKECLKLRDQTIRKHDQELDSLNFRNQQLTKRVVVLQEELDQFQETGKKGRQRHDNITTEESKLFQEELQNRIVENAKLICELEDRNQEHEKEKELWLETARRYEVSLRQHHCATGQLCDNNSVLRTRVTSEEDAAHEKNNAALSKQLQQQQQQDDFKHDLRSSPHLPPSKVISELEAVPGGGIDSDYRQQLRTASVASSLNLIVKVLHHHISKPNETDENASNPTMKQLLALLIKIEDALIHCLDAKLMPSQMEAMLRDVGEAVESLLTAATYNSKAMTGGASVDLLDSLYDRQESSDRLSKSGNEVKLNLDSNVHNICRRCQVHMQHNATMEELNDKLGNSMCISENVTLDLNGPVSAPETEDVALEPQHLHNEFGDGFVVPEAVWRSSSVKELLCLNSHSVIASRQLAESKLTRVLSECDAARCRLEQSLEELQAKKSFIARLQEELSVTTRNYELQLSSMSEHMANMNDKLAAQQTMIEELTYQLNSQNKNNHKGRSK